MRRFLIYTLALIMCSCSAGDKGQTLSKENERETGEIYEFGIRVTDCTVEEGIIQRGEFFNNLMIKLGVPATDIYSLTEASKDIFDLRKLKVGNGYKAYFTSGEEKASLAHLIYQSGRTSYVIFSLRDTISVSIYEKEVTTKTKLGEVRITSSLWEDISRAGINVALASRVEDIYAWSIDFFGLQKGDFFRVVYDEISVGDEVVDIGTVYSAAFFHGGKNYQAYRFIEDDSTSVQYFNEKGENLKKAFLKAPLRFTRISSGFSYSRRHPVSRIVRPHTGVDYAAPKGTRVMTIGDGVVVQRGYSGGGGNTVKIKHNATYTSAYLHLSGYAPGLRVGSRVRQGDVIGYVGSTGLSTGPHLDFRIWRNGSPINPLKMESPPAKEVNKSNMASFMVAVGNAQMVTDSLVSCKYLDTLVNRLRE